MRRYSVLLDLGPFFPSLLQWGDFVKNVYGTLFFFLDPLSWDFGIVSLIEFMSFFLSIHVTLDLYLSYISTVFLLENPTMLSTCYISIMPTGMPVHFFVKKKKKDADQVGEQAFDQLASVPGPGPLNAGKA